MVLGTPKELKALPAVSPEGTHRIAIATEGSASALQRLKHQAFVLDATLVEAEIHLLLPTSVDAAHVLAQLRAEGIEDASARAIEPSLEDVFVTLTRSLAKK